MSAINILSTLNNINQQNNEANLNTSIHTDIDALRLELTRVREQYQRPYVFLKSSRNALSSNVSNDVIILQGPPVPVGYRGVITDFNLNFGTVAGTVKWVITGSNGLINANLVTGIAASQNGQGATVLQEGESFAVAGQTAGAGTFDTFCTGYIYKVT